MRMDHQIQRDPGCWPPLGPHRGPQPLMWQLQTQSSAGLQPQGVLPLATGDWLGAADAAPAKD